MMELATPHHLRNMRLTNVKQEQSQGISVFQTREVAPRPGPLVTRATLAMSSLSLVVGLGRTAVMTVMTVMIIIHWSGLAHVKREAHELQICFCFIKFLMVIFADEMATCNRGKHQTAADQHVIF